MDGVLCSSGFRKFFSSVLTEAETLSELIKLLGDTIHIVSDEIYLGRLDFEVDSGITLEELGTDSRKCTVFSDDYNPEVKIEKHYITHDNGDVLITVYPSAGHVWDSDETEAVEFLLQTLFVMCAKTRAFAEVNNLAVRDQLTGVLNRQGLARYCEKMLLGGMLGGFTAVFLNIRNFKFINQNIGTRSGDKVLKTYAEKLSELAGDGTVARLGGDNFIVFVRDEESRSFIKSTGKITVTFGEFMRFDLTAKVGVYKIGIIDTITDILNSASMAYTVAKQSLNDRVVYFTPEIFRQSTNENEIIAVFPEALKNREFQVYFQPKVRMDSGRLCGCEALVRWDRNGQIVPPNDFVPVLERTGAVCDLDFYMLEGTCHWIRYWLDNSIAPVRVSVNFSKIHLHNARLCDDIHDVLKKYNVPPRYIEIELTETSCHEDYDAMLQFIKEMRSRGFGVSIDDFGTGYSSLNMLKDIHVDMIKLDKSFVDSIEENGEQARIVIRNIVNTIVELGMEVIAEGVEKLSQVNFLEEIGCNMAQGFRFGKPMDAGRFTNELISDMG